MKKIIFRLFFFVGMLFSLGACTHSIHLVHVSDFETVKTGTLGQPVSATDEQKVILGFIQQTDFVDRAYRKLSQQCPSGVIHGITTDYSTDHGFFSWTNVIRLKGFCTSKEVAKGT